MPVLSAGYCFIGVEEAVNASSVLVLVDTESSMV